MIPCLSLCLVCMRFLNAMQRKQKMPISSERNGFPNIFFHEKRKVFLIIEKRFGFRRSRKISTIPSNGKGHILWNCECCETFDRKEANSSSSNCQLKKELQLPFAIWPLENLIVVWISLIECPIHWFPSLFQ